jgi:acetolactate synthase-1/2/3 large subunit
MKKYSDIIATYLLEAGYTHCFTVSGGNIMHLVGSFYGKFSIIPVVHEVSAGIAAEYFNESQKDKKAKKAFALVTAGPGLTNIVTAIAGSYLESRELLIIGGQVKTEDLSQGKLRQKGIQEIDGARLVSSITKSSIRLDHPIGKKEFFSYLNTGAKSRKGPVFIEMPLDVQARKIDNESDLDQKISVNNNLVKASLDQINQSISLIKSSKRPVILIGGGIERQLVAKIYHQLDHLSIPIMTTWNAMDRIGSEHKLYFGRPNTWGQRYANVLLQQSDLLIAIGTRLGMQQTGFNWQEFVPQGQIIQVDCDSTELKKGHPKIDFAICADANHFLEKLIAANLGEHNQWLKFCKQVKTLLPLDEKNNNVTAKGFISPYEFVTLLSRICKNDDIVIPCSSGGAFTVMMQGFLQKKGQIMISNKALASMGYGLGGAIGAAISSSKRTILVEGDGGFSQNLQELATAASNKLNLKIFLFENNGYASIRMTQQNYFNGNYVGCDTKTGLGFPNWEKLFFAYDIPTFTISNSDFVNDKKFIELFNNPNCAAFIVRIDPEQTYFPKISSKVTADGGMKSNPLHLMSPDLDSELTKKVIKYL